MNWAAFFVANNLTTDQYIEQYAYNKSKLIKSFSGGEVPAENTVKTFTITQDDVYAAYSSATYDYGFGSGSVSVFAN